MENFNELLLYWIQKIGHFMVQNRQIQKVSYLNRIKVYIYIKAKQNKTRRYSYQTITNSQEYNNPGKLVSN